MHPDFWHQRWERHEIGFHQADLNAHLTTHWPTLGLPGGCRVLVPLCGKSKDLWWLRDQGFDVVGVELSSVAAHDLFEEAGVTPVVGPFGPYTAWRTDGLTVLQGDLFDLPPDLRFTGLYDRAATVALPSSLRSRYAARLAEAVEPGGRMLLSTLDYPQDERDGPPFSVDADEVERLYAEAFTLTQVAHAEQPEQAAAWGLSRLSNTAWTLTRNG